MSIAILKKKTQAKYNNYNGQSQFSLNGGYRNQGWVGQTSLSRSLANTPMVGTVAKGYGGCCGFYTYGPIVQSGVQSQNNPNVIKQSSINTRGLMLRRYSQIPISGTNKCVYWKPGNNTNNNSQSSYIQYVKEEAIHYADSSNCAIVTSNNPKCCYESVEQQNKRVNTMSQSEYLAQYSSGCFDASYTEFYVPNNTVNIPTSCGANVI